MKAPALFAAALLTLGLSTAATAQTTPATPSNTNINNTNPLSPSNNEQRVQGTPSGASISNNRDVLSPGTGTPAPPARTEADKQAHRQHKAMKKAEKGKM